MKKLLIHDSAKNNRVNIIFCLVLIVILGLVFLNVDILHLAVKLILIIAMGVLGAVAAYFNHRRRDNRPLYIIDHKGIFSRDDDQKVAWADLSYFETHVRGSRPGPACKQIQCFNAAGLKLLTIDLLNSDISLQSVEKLLQKKLTKNHPANPD